MSIRKTAPYLVLGSLVILASGAAVQASTLKQDAAKLEVEVKPKFSGVSWEETRIRLDVEFYNPTSTRLEFSFPKIDVFAHGGLLATSVEENARIVLDPGVKTSIKKETGKDLIIVVSTAQAAVATAGEIHKLLLVGSGVPEIPVMIQVQTTGYAKIVGIPFKKQIVITQDTVITI